MELAPIEPRSKLVNLLSAENIQAALVMDRAGAMQPADAWNAASAHSLRFSVLCKTPLSRGLEPLATAYCYFLPRAEIRLQNQRRLIVKNNESAIAGEFLVQDLQSSAIRIAPSVSSKSPARFPARAQLAHFLSFNFTNKLIHAIASSPFRGLVWI